MSNVISTKINFVHLKIISKDEATKNYHYETLSNLLLLFTLLTKISVNWKNIPNNNATRKIMLNEIFVKRKPRSLTILRKRN